VEIVYGLNAENRIVTITGDWDGFALANDSSTAVARLVLYRSLWEFIDGKETREFLMNVVDQCRASSRSYSALYRCDSGTIRRLLRMTVTAAEHGMVFVEHRTVRSNRMTMAASPDQLQVNDAARCSFCCGLRFGDLWWPSVAIPDPLYFPRSYVICPECRARLARDTAGSEDAGPNRLLLNGFGATESKVIPFPVQST
jgi:hypothetical protein